MAGDRGANYFGFEGQSYPGQSVAFHIGRWIPGVRVTYINVGVLREINNLSGLILCGIYSRCNGERCSVGQAWKTIPSPVNRVTFNHVIEIANGRLSFRCH